MTRPPLARCIVPALLVLIVAGPFTIHHLVNDDPTATLATLGQERLVIMTPHGDQIRQAFAHAFNVWRHRRGEPAVYFDYRTMGGTSDLRKQVFSQFAALVRHQRENDGIGVDLFFGGGPYEHDKLADGITVQRDGAKVSIPLSVPCGIPSAALAAAFPEEWIGGEPLLRRDPATGHPLWIGTALSSFGIVSNHDVLAMLNLPLPKTWADLGDARYAGWVAMADPGHSGSVAATCHTVLQHKGWHRGWEILRRIYANARYFASSASKVPLDVSAGEAAAGMCIDFYGRYQAGAMPDERIAYVDPRRDRTDGAPLETAVTADPISILRGSPSPKLARTFVRWVLSTEAQRLWQRHPGTEGGPRRHALRRVPVRRDLFTTKEMALWTDPANPFLSAKPLPPGMPNFYRLVAPLSHAMAIDIHDDLKAAWRAIHDHRDDNCRRHMLTLFDAMPPNAEDTDQDAGITIPWPPDLSSEVVAAIIADPTNARYAEVIETIGSFAQRLKQRYTTPGSTRNWNDEERLRRDRLAWTRFFRSNYREIVAISSNAATCSSTPSASASKSYPPSKVETIRPSQWRTAAAVK